MMSQRHAEYNAEVSKEERAAEFERLKAEVKSLQAAKQQAEQALELIYNASGQERGTPETVVAGIQHMRLKIDELVIAKRDAEQKTRALEAKLDNVLAEWKKDQDALQSLIDLVNTGINDAQNADASQSLLSTQTEETRGE